MSPCFPVTIDGSDKKQLYINGLASVTLTTNHRSPIVEELIDFYTNSHKQGLIKL